MSTHQTKRFWLFKIAQLITKNENKAECLTEVVRRGKSMILLKILDLNQSEAIKKVPAKAKNKLV